LNKPSQLDHSPEGAAVNLGPYFPSCSAAHFVVIQASKEPRAQKNCSKNSAGGRADDNTVQIAQEFRRWLSEQD
jgi:hypothetical protein